MFNQESYSISINEDNLVNTNILNFSVEDPDVGDDGSISLYIEASTNIGNIFKLGNSGPISNNINSMILSALSLDRETPGLSLNSSDGSALWNLKIIAFDNSADVSLKFFRIYYMNFPSMDKICLFYPEFRINNILRTAWSFLSDKHFIYFYHNGNCVFNIILYIAFI